MYTTKIKKSNFFETVSVRKYMGVFEKDKVGFLRQGTEITGRVVFVKNEAGDIWLQLEGGSYDGYWVALRYNGKVFVESLPVDPDLPPEPQPEGIRAYIMPNYEKQDVDWWPNHPPIPDTRNIVGANVNNNGRIEYTRRIQVFLYNELQRYVPEMSIGDFDRDFLYWCNDKLAFFNKAGSKTRRVYPLNINMKARNMEGNILTFAGKTIYLLSDKPSLIFDRLRYPLKVINAQDPNLEDFNSFDHPDKWVRPSITFGPTVERCEPFDRFKARGRMPMMLNGTDVGWIEADKVRLLRPDEPTPPQFTKDWGY